MWYLNLPFTYLLWYEMQNFHKIMRTIFLMCRAAADWLSMIQINFLVLIMYWPFWTYWRCWWYRTRRGQVIVDSMTQMYDLISWLLSPPSLFSQFLWLFNNIGVHKIFNTLASASMWTVVRSVLLAMIDSIVSQTLPLHKLVCYIVAYWRLKNVYLQTISEA